MDRWLVVGIALAVGVFQFITAHRTTLSPWKGGGFGMFAVVDSPGARFIKAEGITTAGKRIRLHATSGLERNVRRRWRSRPLNSQLESLADDLLQREFVRTNLKSVAAAEQLRREVPKLGETLQLKEDTGTLFYRVRKEDDPAVESQSVFRLRSIQLQWWRIQYDHGRRRIFAKPLFPRIERATELP